MFKKKNCGHCNETLNRIKDELEFSVEGDSYFYHLSGKDWQFKIGVDGVTVGSCVVKLNYCLCVGES